MLSRRPCTLPCFCVSQLFTRASRASRSQPAVTSYNFFLESVVLSIFLRLKLSLMLLWVRERDFRDLLRQVQCHELVWWWRTFSRPHGVCTPPADLLYAATFMSCNFMMPHSFVSTQIYMPAFTLIFNLYDDTATFTPVHLCLCCIDATALTSQLFCRSHASAMWSALTPLHSRHSICRSQAASFVLPISLAAALTLQYLCHRSYAAAFVQSLAHFCVYGATFTPLRSRSTYAVVITPQHWIATDAAALTLLYFFAALTQQPWCHRSYASVFMQHLSCHRTSHCCSHAAAAVAARP